MVTNNFPLSAFTKKSTVVKGFNPQYKHYLDCIPIRKLHPKTIFKDDVRMSKPFSCPNNFSEQKMLTLAQKKEIEGRINAENAKKELQRMELKRRLKRKSSL